MTMIRLSILAILLAGLCAPALAQTDKQPGGKQPQDKSSQTTQPDATHQPRDRSGSSTNTPAGGEPSGRNNPSVSTAPDNAPSRGAPSRGPASTPRPQ